MFPLILRGGSFPSLGQFPYTSTNQCSAKYLKGILYISQILCAALSSLRDGPMNPSCLCLPVFISVPSTQGVFPFPEPQLLNSLKILTWGSTRAHLICFLVLSNQYPLLPGVQYFKKCCFTYFVYFLLLFLVE